ncbi:MAG: FAD/NAD(P)-binding oxidoreductase [Acidimicrobiia bacterium]|nr:MAG: FAD/NAD(P)-binding oxidoreductase [Acidimicrobiia bacterium]
MADSKSIVILGGGIGGVVAARELRRRLPRQDRVVLVERGTHLLFAPSLLWALAGTRTIEQISRPLERLERHGIEVMTAEVTEIDPTQRRVTLGDGRSLEADALIVALGAELDPNAVPGLAAAGHCLYTADGVAGVRRALEGFTGGTVAVLTAAPGYKCPAAPYEAALLLEHMLDEKGLGGSATVEVHAAEPGPMGTAGPEVSAGVRSMLQARGIAYHPDRQVARVDPEAHTMQFSDGTTAGYDLLAFVPHHRAPKPVRDSPLVDDSGWVPVDRSTLATRFDGVFAIGDVTQIPLAMGKPLPRAGVFAERQAIVVARNLADSFTGGGRSATFEGKGECFIETGDGRAGLGRGDFYAEPTPRVGMHQPSRRWHALKVAFEKYWFRRWL